MLPTRSEADITQIHQALFAVTGPSIRVVWIKDPLATVASPVAVGVWVRHSQVRWSERVVVKVTSGVVPELAIFAQVESAV